MTDRRRLRLPFGATVTFPLQAILLILLGRCFYLQVIRGDEFARLQSTRTRSATRVDGERGRILSSDGVTLAEDSPYWKVAIDPNAAGGSKEDDDATREQRLRTLLRRCFAETPLCARADRRLIEREAIRRLRNGTQFYWIGTVESVEEFDRFVGWRSRDSDRRVFTFEARARRRYPRGELAAQLVGPRRTPNEFWGVETWMNRSLSGRDGLRCVEIDGRRRALHHDMSDNVDPRPGEDVVLTIDSRIQRLIELRIRAVKEEFSARAVAAVVMEPRTGAILAMASVPFEDEVDCWTDRLTPEERALRCKPQITQLAYEPGSTIKPLIFAEAVLRGIDRKMTVKPDEGYTHYVQVGRNGRPIHDVTRKGPFTVDQAVIHSSNVGMANVGRWLGQERLAACLDRFELGRKVGFDLPEERGARPLDPGRPWQWGTTLSVPYGYEILVTPLQIVRAYAAFANGGYRVTPHVIARRGDVDCRRQRGERILPWSVVSQVRDVLHQVVAVGISEDLADVDVAGKTGTANKLTWNPEAKRMEYDSRRHRSSFIGFAPVDDPRYLMMMIVDEPQGEKHFGGDVARPTVLQTLADLLDPDQGFFQRVREIHGVSDAGDPVDLLIARTPSEQLEVDDEKRETASRPAVPERRRSDSTDRTTQSASKGRASRPRTSEREPGVRTNRGTAR
ncbi:MAG: penicillin-binding protein 2 [Planctomycetes bacterium]|nr:penicillin-binding protein 2 [Planctomycetota bacterium]